MMIVVWIAVGQNPAHRNEQWPARPTRVAGIQYPRLALFAGVAGEVIIDVVVAGDGAVSDAVVVSGNSLLRDAATNSVRKWRFEPCASDRSNCQTTIQFEFKLAPGSCDISRGPNDVVIDLPAKVSSHAAKAIVNYGAKCPIPPLHQQSRDVGMPISQSAGNWRNASRSVTSCERNFNLTSKGLAARRLKRRNRR